MAIDSIEKKDIANVNNEPQNGAPKTMDQCDDVLNHKPAALKMSLRTAKKVDIEKKDLSNVNNEPQNAAPKTIVLNHKDLNTSEPTMSEIQFPRKPAALNMSRRTAKKVAKKRQSQKKDLQTWKLQIEEGERRKALATKFQVEEEEKHKTLSKEVKPKENRIADDPSTSDPKKEPRPEQKKNIIADDLSSIEPVDYKLWGFSDDEEEINENLDKKGEESNEIRKENEDELNECKASSEPCNEKEDKANENVDELRPLTYTRKRKSTAYDAIEGSELGPPIRKSRRLEEKRLVKSKID